MEDEKRILIGIQMSADGAQITWYNSTLTEPQTLSLPGEGEEREELLRQALEAARRETGRALPPGPGFPFWPAAALLLGAALILKLSGVL